MGVYGLITGLSISGDLNFVISAARVRAVSIPPGRSDGGQPTGNGKTAHSILLWQLESKSLDVVIYVRHVGKFQVNEALISAGEGFVRFLALDLDIFYRRFSCCYRTVVIVVVIAKNSRNTCC